MIQDYPVDTNGGAQSNARGFERSLTLEMLIFLDDTLGIKTINDDDRAPRRKPHVLLREVPSERVG